MTGDGGPTLAEAFQRDGHAMLRGAVGDPVRAGSDRGRGRDRAGLRRGARGARRAPQVDYLTAIKLRERNPALRDVCTRPASPGWPRRRWGSERVRLLYDQLFAKPPGAVCTLWHQDQVFLPIDASDVVEEGGVGLVRSWVSLDALARERRGPALRRRLAPHRAPSTVGRSRSEHPGAAVTAPSTAATTRSPTTARSRPATPPSTPASRCTGRRATPSDRTRYGVTVVYVPDGARVAEPADELQEQAIALHTPGRRAGRGHRHRPPTRSSGPPRPRDTDAYRSEGPVAVPAVPRRRGHRADQPVQRELLVLPPATRPRTRASSTDRTFAAALDRAVEYRDALLEFQRVEPGLLRHRRRHHLGVVLRDGRAAPAPPGGRVRPRGSPAAGLRPIINTNGALLTPRPAEELMDAGLAMACFNVGEIDEQYDAVYGLRSSGPGPTSSTSSRRRRAAASR